MKNHSIYTLQRFKKHVLKCFGNNPKVLFFYIAACYDFKEYYDKFIDQYIKNKQFSQVEKTQLVFRVQPLRNGIDDFEKESMV